MRGREAGGILEILDADGNAGQWARIAASGDHLIDPLRLLEGPMSIDGHERVDLGVQHLDPLEGMRGQRDGGALTGANLIGEFGGAVDAEVHDHWLAPGNRACRGDSPTQRAGTPLRAAPWSRGAGGRR